jgi:hypothetical protein
MVALRFQGTCACHPARCDPLLSLHHSCPPPLHGDAVTHARSMFVSLFLLYCIVVTAVHNFLTEVVRSNEGCTAHWMRDDNPRPPPTKCWDTQPARHAYCDASPCLSHLDPFTSTLCSTTGDMLPLLPVESAKHIATYA